MAHSTINFEFESIASVASEQEVEFGVLYVTWMVRFRGMKDPSVAKRVDQPPVASRISGSMFKCAPDLPVPTAPIHVAMTPTVQASPQLQGTRPTVSHSMGLPAPF